MKMFMKNSEMLIYNRKNISSIFRKIVGTQSSLSTRAVKTKIAEDEEL